MKSVLTFLLLLSSISTFSQTILLDETFDGPGLPTGWSQTTNATDGGWLQGTHTDLQSMYWPIASHGNIIATNDDACDCDKSVDYLITPPLDLSGSDPAVLQFQNYFDGGSLFGGTELATVEYSLDSGVSWALLQTITGTDDGAWDAQSVSLSSLMGNANVLLGFHYFDDNNWLFGWGIDDVLVFKLEALDLQLSSLTVNPTLDILTPTPVTGTVTNTGTDLINSFDISWTLGGSVFTSNISGVSIPSLGTYSFTHGDLLTLTTTGLDTLEVSISNVNGMPIDSNLTNNDLSMELSGVEFATLMDGGINREYLYYHPTSALPNCPLVLVCHGYTGTAEDIMNYSRFNALAEEFGFAVCYPQGIEDSFGNSFFNVGYDFQMGETVDDVAFVVNLIDTLQSTYSLSGQDVFCTGMSNGGDFSYMLACQASETFRAVAPISGMMLQGIEDTCNPVNEVSILEIHGSDDDVTYMAGDPTNIDGWGAYPSIPNTITFWKDRFGLTTLTSASLPDINAFDGSTVASEKYTESGSCSQVWLYTVTGGGHDWPGAWGNMDISASREAWLFFEQLCTPITALEEIEGKKDRTLVRIVDVLGRTTQTKKGVVLIYQYSDGSYERKMIAD